MEQIANGTFKAWKEQLIQRVLHWSSEILARVQDNVINEDTFLMDYDDDKVDDKINTWVAINQAQIDKMLQKYPPASEECRTVIENELENLTAKLRINLRKDYYQAYKNIKTFNKRVDLLGKNERKLHFKIQKLKEKYVGSPQKFRKKFRPLYMKVLNNLMISERMMFQDKRFKIDFTKKVYDIDHKNFANYTKRVEKLLRNFKNNNAKLTKDLY